MREIKLRYWNSVTNQMVNEPQMPFKEGWTIEQLFSDRGWQWMQYTGLKDKNGKEIYEGDILMFPDTESEYVDVGIGEVKVAEQQVNIFYPIEFRNGEFGFEVTQFSEILERDWYSLNQIKEEICLDSGEIIGNIYENPELLSTPKS